MKRQKKKPMKHKGKHIVFFFSLKKKIYEISK